MPFELAAAYKSPSQRARIISEGWGRENLYCTRCTSPKLQSAAPNTRAVDFICPQCDGSFQLKCQSHPFARKICDAAYDVMRRAIEKNTTPHLFALHYDRLYWTVQSLVFIPSFALTLSSLERRKPLGPSARRAGWVGCNILLANIPMDARIPLVSDGVPLSPAVVRRQYRRFLPLEQIPHETRGWTLDVLAVVRSLGKTEFSLGEVYGQADRLQQLHPDNRHVREKIRQQLQRLRDLDVLQFAGSGRYLLRA
jgi:type II restriction enzyme